MLEPGRKALLVRVNPRRQPQGGRSKTRVPIGRAMIEGAACIKVQNVGKWAVNAPGSG